MKSAETVLKNVLTPDGLHEVKPAGDFIAFRIRCNPTHCDASGQQVVDVHYERGNDEGPP